MFAVLRIPSPAKAAIPTDRLALTLIVIGAMLTACGPRATAPTPTAAVPTPAAPTATVPAVDASPQVAINEEHGFCFEYPEGFTYQSEAQIAVVGDYSGSGPQPAIMWVDVTDAGGRTAEAVANEEIEAFGGNPPRYSLMLGGEEALVLDGMPGQDPVRRVYIVHGGQLFTLTFSPYLSGIAAADAQMEVLYGAVTPSWRWLSPDTACSAEN
ncbi:MAG TPA: hypothetical protein VFI11_03485 [Anaerolineales bacterium]|nr:hypothetical protein [Anaerolineales bacterium]